MEQLVMSALMSATARRTDLTEYARLEYPRAEAPRIEGGRLREFGRAPARDSPAPEPCTREPVELDPVRAGSSSFGEESRAPARTADSAAVPSYGTRVLSRPARESKSL